MGSSKPHIKKSQDGRPRLFFSLPGDTSGRWIELVNDNILDTSRGLSAQLNGHLDAYYEKASIGWMRHVGRFNRYRSWLKPKGFLIVNSYTAQEEYSDLNKLLGGFVNVSKTDDNLQRLILGREIRRGEHYGWDMDVLQNMAMASDKVGGIDLTSDKALKVQNNGQAIKFYLDPAQLAALQNASSFTPVIINIQPVTDLHLWLGISVV